MKLKMKVNELINILIQKDEDPLVEKYRLNKEKINSIQKSLRKGDWKFIG